MDILNDFLNINKETLKKTFISLKDNWVIIFSGIVYTILTTLIFTTIFTLFTGVLSLIAGIIAAVVSAALISNYLYLLYKVINYGKIKLQDFKDGFTYFLRKVYGVFFFAWIGSYLLSIVGRAIGPNIIALNAIISLSILVLLNALPETIYLKSLDPMDSIVYSLDFMKENWLNWLIPNVLLYLSIYIVTGKIITNLFATSISGGIFFGGANIIVYLIGQLLFSFTMIYRGHLYKLLSTSTRRKRMYMRKF